MAGENSEVWFITPATGGTGAKIVKAALASDDQVVAAGPKTVEEALGSSDSLLAIALDVTLGRPHDHSD
jgi:hypothetical protein